MHPRTLPCPWAWMHASLSVSRWDSGARRLAKLLPPPSIPVDTPTVCSAEKLYPHLCSRWGGQWNVPKKKQIFSRSFCPSSTHTALFKLPESRCCGRSQQLPWDQDKKNKPENFRDLSCKPTPLTFTGRTYVFIIFYPPWWSPVARSCIQCITDTPSEHSNADQLAVFPVFILICLIRIKFTSKNNSKNSHISCIFSTGNNRSYLLTILREFVIFLLIFFTFWLTSYQSFSLLSDFLAVWGGTVVHTHTHTGMQLS